MSGNQKIIFVPMLATLFFMSACKDRPQKAPSPASAPQTAPEPQPETGDPSEPDGVDADAADPAAPEPASLASDAVRVSVSPGTLEVLQDNTLRLNAALPADRPEATCRWILSGGADEAAAGCAADFDVPEVDADILWTLVVTEAQIEVLRREGRIPLERLWVKGQARQPGQASGPVTPPTGEQASGPGTPPTGEWASGPGTPPTGEQASGPGTPPTGEQGANREEIAWRLSPAELAVLQDTTVALTADAPADATCAWDLGDGAPPLEGCAVTSVFREAHGDRTVTLTVRRAGERVYSGARVLPLERLSVTPRTPQPGGALPACDAGCRRLAVATVQGGGLDRAYALATGTGAEALVLFLHAPLPETSALEDLARYLGARKIALLPVACGDGLGRDALATLLTSHALAAGLVLHSDAAELPARYAMQWGPAFIAALPTRADIPDEKWLTGQLETAAMFRSRLLLSCRAFDRLTGDTPELLPSPYRQYEKMRRGGLQLFVSGAHGAFYPGTYGNLRTLSPGRLQGPSAALLGQEGPQGPAAALVDIDEQRIARVTGVVPAGDGWAPLPEESLPEKVGVYRIWK